MKKVSAAQAPAPFAVTPEFVSQAQQAIWAPRELRRQLQDQGVNILPANFYATAPTLAEIAESFEFAAPEPPYLNPEIFRPDVLQQWLADLVPLAEPFAPPLEGDKDGTTYFWKNDQFSYSDAASAYAMLRKVKPARVLEIGSGYSTLVARDALAANGRGEITCVEPYPRPFLKEIGVDLREIKAQQLQDPNALLSDGDVLFVDSTHTVKTGSDCLHIYLRLLPSIRRRIYVHVHDIFLPFGMPRAWQEDFHIHWTEQYLLLAWLLDNPRATVIYGSAYHERYSVDTLEALMHGRYGCGGSSLWIEYDGRRG